MYLCVAHSDTFHADVGNDICFGGVLAKGAYANPMGTIAIEVGHHDVRRIRFEGHAVIAVIDSAILDRDTVRAIDVPTVLRGILGRQYP